MRPLGPDRGAAGLARRRSGRPPLDRPLPAPLTVATTFPVPDRLLCSPALDPTAKLVGVAVCRLARAGDLHAIGASNDDLARAAGVSPRTVQSALAALESAGFVHRLIRGDALGRDSLRWVGYRDPWRGRPDAHPPRALVLLWRLPPVPAGAREPGPGAAGKGGGR